MSMRAAAPAVFQPDLFSCGEPEIRDVRPTARRLAEKAWIGHAQRWLSGGDQLLALLHEELPWKQEERLMYERIVPVPRLICILRETKNFRCHRLLEQIHARIETLLQRPLSPAFAAYYRGGSDSVAWHSDRVDLRRSDHRSAILSLGGPRTIRFRRKHRTGSQDFADEQLRSDSSSWGVTLASGDLLVMGGRIQHAYEHCIPKCAHADPRIALIYFEHVRPPPRIRSRAANFQNTGQMATHIEA